MSDLRGLSRGSKTAAVVILVVLLQVIVVAVLGLGAIARDREDGARLARNATEQRALEVATTSLDRARAGLLVALEDAARATLRSGGLRTLPFPAAREVYLVDATGRILSGSRVRLHVPPEAIEEEERRADRQVVARYEQSLRGLSASGPDPVATQTRREYVRRFPFRTTEDGYATAVGEALQMAKDVTAAPTGEGSVTDAILLAYETAAVNEGRPAAAQPEFAWVLGELERLVASVADPAERAALSSTLADHERGRRGLAGFREYALQFARDAAGHPSAPRILALRGGAEIIGLAPVVQPAGSSRREALLVRLDRAVIARGIEAAAPPGTVGLRVVPRDTRSEAGDALRLPLERADFDPFLDVLVPYAAVAPASGAAGPRESFYWFILGTAALGVSIAGFVLVRILRREVHLARLKADFVSNLSHELKTPLTSISMFTEMIKEGSLEGDDLTEGIDVIATESERLQRIVGRMIDVARREAHGTGYALVPGDLNAAVRAACERFRRLERDPGLVLEVDLSPAVPPILLDAGAIDDAVTNLLANAWKYRKGDRAHVRVSTRRAGRRVELAVQDDGIGIPRRERRRVFEMFYRAENYLSRNVPGTGLGLALVRTIVRVHRGKVRIEGAPGDGTTFRLAFPLARRWSRPAAPPSPPPTASEEDVADPLPLAGDRRR